MLLQEVSGSCELSFSVLVNLFWFAADVLVWRISTGTVPVVRDNAGKMPAVR
jgi:hypothetical protein